MQSKRYINGFIQSKENLPTDTLESQYSNFRLFGIGKETEAQKRRKAKFKKAIDDAKKNISQTTKDATKSIGSAVKDAEKNIKQNVKDAGKNIKQTTKDVLKNDNLKKFAKARFLTYNPIVAIPRTSALLSFRVNLFGISTRLYPAFLDEATLVKYNFDVANAQNAKRAWEKIANFWEDKIGGDRNKLREAISGAWNKPVFKTKRAKERLNKTSTFDGNYESLYESYGTTGEIGVGAYIIAGLPVVGSLINLINGERARKNPFNQNSPQAQSFENQIEGEIPPPVNKEELEKIIQGALDDKSKGLGLDDTGVDSTDLDASGKLMEDDKILGIPKTAFWIGVSAIVLIGGFVVYKKFIKK
jgi:vacuolar-type H+-ATPase subunit H